jgi:hypothetical protein
MKREMRKGKTLLAERAAELTKIEWQIWSSNYFHEKIHQSM